MIPIKNNEDLACFLVVKHSTWKGKYKRIFSIGTRGISTYNLNLEITNRWPYNEFISIQPVKIGNASQEFQIVVKKEKKAIKMNFSTEHRIELITEALKFRNYFAEKPKETLRFQGYKHHWSDIRLPVLLEVTASSLDQLDPTSGSILASYNFKDFEGICTMSDYPGGFVIVCGGFGRLHLFQAEDFEKIKVKVLENAVTYLGVIVKVLGQPITLEDFHRQRFGKYSDDEHLTSVSEFTVFKIHKPRHTDPVRRILCISETCLLERDPQTYNICTLQPLRDIFALVRDNNNPQLFSIEYVSGQVRTYSSTDRDSLLASMLDSVRASGNKDIRVTMVPTKRGVRLGPLHVPLDEEVESLHLKFLQNIPASCSYLSCIERFNANIPYSGLLYSVSQEGIFSENKEKLIIAALQSLVSKEDDVKAVSSEELEAQFQALRRLLASKIGYSAFTRLQGFREAIGLKVVTALKRIDFGITHAAIDMICALMHPMHEDYDLKQEQLNKSSLLQTKVFLESLLSMWTSYIIQNTGALVVSAMLDFLTFALCIPYSETTEGKQFDTLLEMVADRSRVIFRLFEHSSLAVVKGAGLVMRALIEEGDSEIAAKMQSLALAECALPKHLLVALYTQANDRRTLTHRQLSRHLIGLWVSGNPLAMGLLKRIMPAGLIQFLDSEVKVPDSAKEQEVLNHRDNLQIAQDLESKTKKNASWIAVERQYKIVEKHVEHYTDLALLHWGIGLKLNVKKEEKLKERPIVLRRRRERIKLESNWPLFYYNFHLDHYLPNLIWNYKTREELRCALDTEVRTFASDRELAGNTLVAWNYQEFELDYHCLADEVKIGDYYLRLLLEVDKNSSDSPIRKSYEFFNELYHRFLLTSKVEMKCLCLQAMSIVYSKYFEDIGAFSDTKYIIFMLERCSDKLERDRLVTFVNKLTLHRRNSREIIESGGLKVLTDFMTLAHLHTSRAVVPTQSNVIEASPDMDMEERKEWHYSVEGGRKGPIGFNEMKRLFQSGTINYKTRCWAMGLDSWKPLSQIPQLKWCLLAKGSFVLNESDLATCILNILIRVCEYYPSRDQDDAVIRPVPKIKKLLSEQTSLSHIVQLLLTFDPILVEKVSTVLCEIMRDNPEMPKVYLTGVFYFILMYTGSNVLPIAKFLQLTHMKQAFKSDENTSSDIMKKSILGKLLPEAMVNYLENHGSEKFAQIFLGEFDTPEAIWNSQMRRLLIEKIASHIADFTPRLKCNNMARYLYIAIPTIRYPQLERELFCNIFYLRHLCDTVKFPDWPIPDPIGLLKDVLGAWKLEVEKKPSLMTVTEAYAKLGLEGNNIEESAIRKSYYRLAQHYHPDKNPEGREKFEEVNQAYEFLCSMTGWKSNGPNPNNIVLILKTQSILFCRYSEVLHPYKYAGYPQLIKTIRMETQDEHLFSKTDQILLSACELAYHTVNCSALNAEELRRENGLEVLFEAYSRCVNILNKSSRPEDPAVQISMQITKCFRVAARFRACRECINNTPQVIKDLCRILYFKHLSKLCCCVSECLKALAADPILQFELLKAGALWHLLIFMFKYDYTLDEGGVEKSEKNNEQELYNILAKECVLACASLAGCGAEEIDRSQNDLVNSVLETLLTPFIARQIRNSKPEEVLKLLTSNSETPYLIWNNSTRAELLDFLNQEISNRSELDFTTKDKLIYTAHQGELIIGEVFIRIYNEQPTCKIQEPKTFVIDLLDFLTIENQYLMNLNDISYSVIKEERLKHSHMALEALSNVIRNNTGVEIQCIGQFQLIFSLLNVNAIHIVRHALDVISIVTGNNECINDIAASEVLGYFLLALVTIPDLQQEALNVFNAFLTNTKLVKESFSKGAVIYLLDLFCNGTIQPIRVTAAELLAKMTSDKLVGPKVKLAIEAFLPPIFSDAMRDNSVAAVTMFESEHEHPELLWHQDVKNRVCISVAKLRNEFQAAQTSDINSLWKTPDRNIFASALSTNEIVVGGVYLRIFVENPAWALRRPKEFLNELLEMCLSSMTSGKVDVLALSTHALCLLLQMQPALLDFIPPMGHIPRLFRQMLETSRPEICKSTILILNSISVNKACVKSISQSDCMGPLKNAMTCCMDMVAVACEALDHLFSISQDRLVKQALDVDFVPFLLNLLENQQDLANNPAMTRAQIVKALEAMSRSLLYGDQINQILDRSSIWMEYKEQRHDLFIANSAISGYLTGGTPTTAGYLTQGSNNSESFVTPPPINQTEERGFDTF